VKYNTFVTFYASLVSLSFPYLSINPFLIIFLITSTGQMDEPISMVRGSNDALSSKEVPFWGLIEIISVNGVYNPQNRQKLGVVYGFPAKHAE
jgi:hypothetical protein